MVALLGGEESSSSGSRQQKGGEGAALNIPFIPLAAYPITFLISGINLAASCNVAAGISAVSQVWLPASIRRISPKVAVQVSSARSSPI